MVSQKIDKITIYEAFRLANISINSNTLEAFSFANINNVY